jgi:hypothetical protein
MHFSLAITAWAGYFNMVPDYSISHSEIFAAANTVAVFGSAQGTFSKDGQFTKANIWKTPAGWRAIVKDSKIAVWQVYADNEQTRATMGSARPRRDDCPGLWIHRRFDK